MPVVRLELDIDGEVYPELCAALDAIKSPLAREERLRQLAAMGLVWEAVRVHGPAVTRWPAEAEAAPLASPAAEQVPAAVAPPSRGAGVPAASPPRGAEIPAAVAPPRGAEIPAAIAPPRGAEIPAASPPRGARSAPRSASRKSPPAPLPVLVDIVSTSPAEIPAPVLADADEAPPPAEQPMPIVGIARGSGARTRLQRMKDRGLFRNG